MDFHPLVFIFGFCPGFVVTSFIAWYSLLRPMIGRKYPKSHLLPVKPEEAHLPMWVQKEKRKMEWGLTHDWRTEDYRE